MVGERQELVDGPIKLVDDPWEEVEDPWKKVEQVKKEVLGWSGVVDIAATGGVPPLSLRLSLSLSLPVLLRS